MTPATPTPSPSDHLPSSTAIAPVGVGVIGLGFMGSTHVRAYQAAALHGLCELVAVADKSAERLTGKPFSARSTTTGENTRIFDPAKVRGYYDPRELLDNPRVHLVSICTHTDTHVDLAVAALNKGKHVIIEKPVALTSTETMRLARAAVESSTLCMPAMCMRFWPGWRWLREAIITKPYGKTHSATFQRLGSPPNWAEFYANIARSGGALIDLHIHDADFIRWCFGEPQSVCTTGTDMHVSTIYRYPSGPTHVTAEGAQDYTAGFAFRMRYVVAFDHATADFDSTRSPQLLLHQNGQSTPVELPDGNGYFAEVRHMLEAIRAGRRTADLDATLDDAVKTMRLLETERASMLSGMPQAFIA